MALRTERLVPLVVFLLAGCLGGPSAPPADTAGDEAEEARPIEWPPLAEAALRPGDKLFPEDIGTDDGFSIRTCTVNFVFVSQDNASVFIGTAAHCLTDMPLGGSLEVSGKVRATLEYCSWATIDEADHCTDKATGGALVSDEEGFANDFALLRVDPEDAHLVHPALRHWGGPTGIATQASQNERVMTYGNSIARDAGQRDTDVHDAREGYVRESEEWTTFVVLITQPLPGDSGSPVLLADGEALGVVQTWGLRGAGIVNLDAALAYYNEHAEAPVRLATWDLLQSPMIPPLPATGR